MWMPHSRGSELHATRNAAPEIGICEYFCWVGAVTDAKEKEKRGKVRRGAVFGAHFGHRHPHTVFHHILGNPSNHITNEITPLHVHFMVRSLC